MNTLLIDAQAAPDLSPRRRRRLSPRQTFWAVLVTFFAANVLWSLANPLMAAVDEPAHTVKAAATVRGELEGDPEGLSVGIEDFRVPQLFAQIAAYPNCIAFNSMVSAACQPELVGDLGAETEQQSSAARYNPLYYAVVGLPSLFPVGEVTIYLMRAMSGLLAAIGLAFAARTVAELRSPSWVALGLLVCLTPAVLYLSSSINPQSIELVGALGMWVALLALLREPDPDLISRRMGRLALGTLLLANARGLGPFFVALIVVACVVSVPWSHTVAVLRDRRGWPGLAVCVASSVAALAWIVFGGSLPVTGVIAHPDYTPRSLMMSTLENTSAYVENMLGIFGWLDTPLPGWLYLLLGSMIAVVAFLGFIAARRRDQLVMVALLGAVGGIPIAVHIIQAPQIGIFWQGRYILPLAFGVPLLAAFASRHRHSPLTSDLGLLALRWGGIVLVVGQVTAFVINLHRYVNGFTGGWLSVTASSWSPPIHPWLLVVLFGAAMLALVEAVYRSALPSFERPVALENEAPASGA